MTRRDLRELLDRAIVQWATEKRDAVGDMFATASDLEHIKNEPLAFSDLLDSENAKNFIHRLLAIQEADEQAAADHATAEFQRKYTFETSCGWKLRYDAKRKTWTDGDLEFADVNGYPVDIDGEILHGEFWLIEKPVAKTTEKE